MRTAWMRRGQEGFLWSTLIPNFITATEYIKKHQRCFAWPDAIRELSRSAIRTSLRGTRRCTLSYAAIVPSGQKLIFWREWMKYPPSCYRFTRLENLRPMVVKLAFQCYRRLPPWAKAQLEPEDLVQEGMMRLKDIQKNYWKPDKGKFTTFGYRCIVQHFCNISTAYSARKRAALTEPIENFQVCYHMRLESWVSAKLTYHKVLRQASPELRRFLAGFSAGRGKKDEPRPRRGRTFRKIQSELLAFRRRYGFSYADMELCMKYGFEQFEGGTDGGWSFGQEIISVRSLSGEVL